MDEQPPGQCEERTEPVPFVAVYKALFNDPGTVADMLRRYLAEPVAPRPPPCPTPSTPRPCVGCPPRGSPVASASGTAGGRYRNSSSSGGCAALSPKLPSMGLIMPCLTASSASSTSLWTLSFSKIR